MGRILLARHGQTTANAAEVLQGPRIDAPLSPTGERQAAALGRALRGEPFSLLLCSPLLRARQTAQAVVAARPAAPPVELVPALHEMDYGDFAGRPLGEVRVAMQGVLADWSRGLLERPFPGGESVVQAVERVSPVVTRMLAAAEDTTVAVVAHGRLNRILLALLTGTPLTRLEEFPQGNACINELAVSGGKARLVRMNDTAHLEQASASFS